MPIDEERIFFSWDAASWHASKALYEKVEEVNSPDYRKKNKTPPKNTAPKATCQGKPKTLHTV